MPPWGTGRGGRRAFSGGVCLFPPFRGAPKWALPIPNPVPPLLFDHFFIFACRGPASAREVRTGPTSLFLFPRRKKRSHSLLSFFEKLQNKKTLFSDGRRRFGHASPRGLHPPPRPAAAERFLRKVRGDGRARQVPGPGDGRPLRDGGGVQGAAGAGRCWFGGGGGASAESGKRRCCR